MMASHFLNEFDFLRIKWVYYLKFYPNPKSLFFFYFLQELQCRVGGIPSTFRREVWRFQVTRCFYLKRLLRCRERTSKRLRNHYRLLFQHSIGWKWTKSHRRVSKRLFTLGNAFLARGGSGCFHALSDAEKVVGACLFSYWNHGSYPVRGSSVTYFGPFFRIDWH